MEENKKKNTIYDSVIAKVISVLLLCVCGALITNNLITLNFVNTNYYVHKRQGEKGDFYEGDQVKEAIDAMLEQQLRNSLSSHTYYNDSYLPNMDIVVEEKTSFESPYTVIEEFKEDTNKKRKVAYEAEKYGYAFDYNGEEYFAEIDPMLFDIEVAFKEGYINAYKSNDIYGYTKLPDGSFEKIEEHLDAKLEYKDDDDLPDLEKMGIIKESNDENKADVKKDVETNEEVKEEPKVENFRIIRVTGKVMEPYAFSDGLSLMHDSYESGYKLIETSFAEMWVELAIFLIALVFSFSASGHKKNEEGIHMVWVDRIPYEILICMFVFPSIIFGGAGLFNFGHIGDWQSTYLQRGLGIGALMVGSLGLLVVMLSTARRIKAHKFAENLLIVRLFKMLGNAKGAYVTYIYIGVMLWLYLKLTYAYYEPLLFAIILLVTMLYAGLWQNEINRATNEIRNGNMDVEIKGMKYMVGPFKKQAENIMGIKESINNAVEVKMQSERMKTELITNVSHDIKTPLTSIINYVDLLQNDPSPEDEKKYLDVLGRQSNRLKRLIEDLIEASKASTGNIKVNLMPVDAEELVQQALGEYTEKFEAAKVEPIVNVEGAPISLYVDGRMLWRVYSNLFSNVSKYALEGTRVYIDMKRIENHKVKVSVKNISKQALNIEAQELLERFVQGDESRSDSGSGLGLNIAKSFVELMGGEMKLYVDGDLFKVDVILNEYIEKEESNQETESTEE